MHSPIAGHVVGSSPAAMSPATVASLLLLSGDMDEGTKARGRAGVSGGGDGGDGDKSSSLPTSDAREAFARDARGENGHANDSPQANGMLVFIFAPHTHRHISPISSVHALMHSPARPCTRQEANVTARWPYEHTHTYHTSLTHPSTHKHTRTNTHTHTHIHTCILPLKHTHTRILPPKHTHIRKLPPKHTLFSRHNKHTHTLAETSTPSTRTRTPTPTHPSTLHHARP